MKKTQISIIAALSENRVIGDHGKIPWHIKADLIHFRDLTLGHVVIMGRKAFDSMWEYYRQVGKQLPKRTHVIITRNKDLDSRFSSRGGLSRGNENEEHLYIVHSIEEAIELGKNLQKNGEIFISGGGQIYEQGLKYADKLYLTIIHKNFEGDACFPDYSEFNKVINREDKTEGPFSFTFLELSR